MTLETERIPCVIMRGGTSKAVFLLANDLPADPARRDAVVLAIFGSPDTRQIDGLGGADPLTSKLAVISVSHRPDADIDYTFGQVDLARPFIDYSSNCGNISSAVGPYAVSQGLVPAVAPTTRVRIYNTNTDKVFEADVPVEDGHPQVLGDYRIDGVPGSGARIGLNFAGTVGSKTGRLLPTGRPVDVLEVPGFGPLTVSLVDAASPMAFVRAADLGLTGVEPPARIDGDPALLELLETIRCLAAVKMSLVSDPLEARTRMRAVPMVAFVSPPQSYPSFTTGDDIRAGDQDFTARDMFMQVMHKAYSLTATVCTASAAVTPGTVVYDIRGPRPDGLVRFGHPCGVIDAEMETANGRIVRAVVGRTARRIMEGYVHVPRRLLAE